MIISLITVKIVVKKLRLIINTTKEAIMSRRGENIYKRKDGRWEGRYIKTYNNGHAVYGYLYAKSYADIKDKIFKKKQELLTSKSTCLISTSVLFEDAAKSWLLSIRQQVKESTYMKYQNLINNYLVDTFENKKIAEINKDMVEIFCNNLLKNGGQKKHGVTSKTVCDALVVFRGILRYNGLHEIADKCTNKELGIKYTSKKIKILTETEQKKLSYYLLDNLTFRNLGILLCLYTGMRIGEICALKWTDISLSEKTICINKTMQRIQIENNSDKKTLIIITEPKSTYSCRVIPLPDCIVSILLKFDNCTGYLLSGDETEYTEPRTLQNHFKRILKEAGIKQTNFHVLRHTFATRCIEANFDIKSLSEILGHANINITLERYVHPTMELKRKNMECLSMLFPVKENSQLME